MIVGFSLVSTLDQIYEQMEAHYPPEINDGECPKPATIMHSRCF